MIKAYFDGSTVDSGDMGIGFVAYDIIDKDKIKIIEVGKYVGNGKKRNSVLSEVIAIYEGLDILLKRGYEDEKIIIFGDNKGVITSINNNKISQNDNYLILYYRKIAKLKSCFKDIRFTWHSRDKNEEADRLSKLGSKKQKIRYYMDKTNHSKYKFEKDIMNKVSGDKIINDKYVRLDILFGFKYPDNRYKIAFEKYYISNDKDKNNALLYENNIQKERIDYCLKSALAAEGLERFYLIDKKTTTRNHHKGIIDLPIDQMLKLRSIVWRKYRLKEASFN